MAVAHAPAGGVSIGGKDFKGGEFVPGETQEAVDKAAGESGSSKDCDFLGACDRLRKKPGGEAWWKKTMAGREEITKREFLDKIDPADALDDGETFDEFLKSSDFDMFFRTGDTYFVSDGDPNGFEFFWEGKPSDEKPEGGSGEPDHKVTKTKEFRKWFGGSKVVESGKPATTSPSTIEQKDGKPLVVFHGTNAEFNVFSNPFDGWNMFSTNRKYSEQFAIDFGPGDRGVVKELYLKAENPLDLSHLPAQRGDARNELLRALKWDEATGERTNVSDEDLATLKAKLAHEKDLFQVINARKSRSLLKEILTRSGFDSMVFPDNKVFIEDNQRKSVEATTWVVFEPTQIKSATGNKGKFDSSNPDITMSLRSGETMTNAEAFLKPFKRLNAKQLQSLGSDVATMVADDRQLIDELGGGGAADPNDYQQELEDELKTDETKALNLRRDKKVIAAAAKAAGLTEEEEALLRDSLQVDRMAVAHAPAGGVTVGGKEFRGGEFIPGEVLDKATKEEKAAIEGKGEAKEAGAEATPETIEKAQNTKWQDWDWKPLEDDLDLYFKRTPESIEVPLDKLTPIRAREKGIANGNRFMWLAAQGANDKRKPLDLQENDDGTFTVLDGNSTFANALASGWTNIVGEVVEDPFTLEREKSNKPVPQVFTNAEGKQKVMFSGMDALPGQMDLFQTDGPAFKEEEEKPKKKKQAKLFATAHAPKGGITIDGKPFKGGQFIKSSVIAAASEEEKSKLDIKGDDDEVPTKSPQDALKAKSLPRIDMPQLGGEEKDKFLEKLEKSGVGVKTGTIDPKKLTGLQSEFNPDKVKGIAGAIKAGTLPDLPILVTADGFVIDGHHRWRAYQEAGQDVPFQEIGLSASQVVDRMHRFKGTERQTVSGKDVSRATGFGPKMATFLHDNLNPVMKEALSVNDFRKPIHKPQPMKTEDEVFEVAKRNHPEYNKILNFGLGVSKDLGAEAIDGSKEGEFGKLIDRVGSGEQKGPFVLLAGLKAGGEGSRSREKVRDNYGGDWGQLRDVVRGTVAVDKFDDIPGAVNSLRKQADKNGWTLSVRPEDRFSNPTAAGYRDLQLFIESPDGLQAEVQVQTKAMFLAKETKGHKLFEEYRSLDGIRKRGDKLNTEQLARLTDLEDQQKELYAGAWAESNS